MVFNFYHYITQFFRAVETLNSLHKVTFRRWQQLVCYCNFLKTAVAILSDSELNHQRWHERNSMNAFFASTVTIVLSTSKIVRSCTSKFQIIVLYLYDADVLRN